MRYVVWDDDYARMLLAPLRDEAKHCDEAAVQRARESDAYVASLASEASFKTQARGVRYHGERTGR